MEWSDDEDLSAAEAAGTKASSSLPPLDLAQFCDTLVSILKTHGRDERMSVSLFQMLTKILQSGVLNPLLTSPSSAFGLNLYEGMKAAVSGSKDPPTILSSIDVFCALTAVGVLGPRGAGMARERVVELSK